MKARQTVRVTYRFKPETQTRLAQICEEQGGLSERQAVENAVERYHRSIFGRRSADLVSPRVRSGGRRGMPG